MAVRTKREGNCYDRRTDQRIETCKNALVNKELSGDEWEEKQEMVKKLEDVTSYLKDALGQGIEF